MPYAMVPPGYRAVLLGSAQNLEDLSTFAPLEEDAAEGALVLMRLDFAEPPSSEALAQLEQACLDNGISPWPGYDYVVFVGADQPAVYLTWQKGFAWLPVIIGILAITALPPLLGGLVWLVLPESLKQLITGLIQMGMMLLVMWLMTSLIKPLAAPETPKRLKEKRT